MKKFFRLTFFATIVAGFLGCSSSKIPNPATGDTSQSSLDWDGIYRGVLPCADCQGIQTTISLNRDQTYKLQTTYLGQEANVQEYSGKFSWNATGTTIQLENTIGGASGKYLVGENLLYQLDANGNKITGTLSEKYILTKAAYAVVERYWKLTELYGKAVVNTDFVKEPHLILKESTGAYNGHGGCNGFSGSYQISGYNKIKFSPAASTMMACKDMTVENQFHQVLKLADSFVLNWDELTLTKARMAPLAKFRAVLMH